MAEGGLTDLHAELVAMRNTLPPPSDAEKRSAKLFSQIKSVSAKLGPSKASHAAHQERTAQEEEEFNKLERLTFERDRLLVEMAKPEADVMGLRVELTEALHELDCRNDPASLFRLAVQEVIPATFAVSRLAILDPKRAIELLRHCQKEEGDDARSSYDDACAVLEGQINGKRTSDPRLDPQKDKAALLAILQDEKSSSEDFDAALGALVPSEDPGRFPDPEIDATLLELLGRGKFDALGGLDSVSRRLATRMGGKAWDALVLAGRQAGFGRVLDDLAIIAQQEPEPFRSKLRELLASELHETRGYLDNTLLTLWQLDLRELKPAIEEIATSGPEDYEGNQGFRSS